MNDTIAISFDTCASEDHYHAARTEKKKKLNVKVLPKSVSYSQDQKGAAEKKKAVSSVSFFITTIHILEEI